MHGVITAMVTPFNEKEEVDYEIIKKLTEFYIKKGVNCLYPNGTTGEMYLLDIEERKKIAETVVEQANKRVDVFIHTGAMTLKDTLILSEHALKIGADGIGVVTPSYFSVNERELINYYIDISRSLPQDFPIYLYNIPQCSSNDLKTNAIQQIVDQCPNIKGVKYSYHDMLRVNEYLKIKSEDFSVVVGADRLFLPALSMGCVGTVSGVSSVCPELFVGIYNAFKAGNIDKARAYQFIANDIVDVLKAGSNMSYFKVALKARGIDAGHMRRPLMDLSKEEIDLFMPAFKHYLQRNDIEINIRENINGQ